MKRTAKLVSRPAPDGGPKLKRSALKTYPAADGGPKLRRSGPPVRKERVKAVSSRRATLRPVRGEVRREVIQRDGGCVFHKMERVVLGQRPGDGGCLGARRQELDVHEVKTRARGGSIYDVDNCVALCRPAHEWVTAHAEAAEALGLIVPSWATPEHEEEAWRLRHRHALLAYAFHAPTWRQGNDRWLAIAHRDLDALWGVDVLPS